MSLPALQSDSVAGTALWLNHVFVHVGGPSDGSSGTGTWSYDTSAQNTISYRASDQHWLDGSPGTGADAPSAITSSSTHSSTTHLANPEYVFLWYNSGDFLGKFANPFYVAPTGGGGDTGTEGVPSSTPSGSLTYRNSTVYYVIDPDSPTTSGTDKYGIMEDGIHLGYSADTIPHTQGQYTSGSVSGSLGSVYTLTYANTLGTTTITNLATITATKGSKVFCNFW